MLKSMQNPFLRTPDGHDGQKFSTRVGEKNTFWLSCNVQNLFLFGQLSRESVKKLIYQKKNGGHQASKRAISM